ncbi:MAG TPA: phosphatidylinositol mannoside acyltransferase [Mycobacteriales bacterium]|jgi:KDO2-lipid IV(A) lauroyltransferase|nr:phosphatidylinositol mannoside acyltransferase [Mycobacteriales bacterium]
MTGDGPAQVGPDPSREPARDRLIGLAYAAGWAAIKALPRRVSATAFAAAADLAYRRQGRGVQRLAGNLRRVRPEASEAELVALTRRAMRSYARYWLETFRLPVMNKATVASQIWVTGAEDLKKAVGAGKGVIIALPHMGNYDIAGVWMVQNEMPFTTVAERLKPDSLFRRFTAYRESLGMEVLALGHGEKPPAETLARRLRDGGIICLVADRDLTASGIEVDFFGATAKMPAGPAFLAATTGAALIPLRLWYEGAGWGMHFYPPVPVVEAARLRDRVTGTTQQLADIFAADIASYPQDWHMLQRMWL